MLEKKINEKSLIIVSPGRNFSVKPIVFNNKETNSIIAFDSILYDQFVNKQSKKGRLIS